ncbi:MAG: hypothetical protein JXQ75_11435 [Phycisphaerae bacterium]|nr:hypothetical protein [Phycisphaerae bacterium]
MLEYQPRHKDKKGDHARPATVKSDQTLAEQCRQRMLAWPNPVEYVNDMYGCHPGEGDAEYFRTVFGK